MGVSENLTVEHFERYYIQMAGKALWKGYIRFGEVNLPVKLHAAISEERIQFHLLHSRDHAKLRQQMICSYEGKPVAAEDQVRGYEVEKGKFIIIDPEELERTSPESSRIIEVREFVGAGEIDPVFLHHPYYLEPDVQVKAYGTLAGALGELEAAGICTWTMRKHNYLGALQAAGDRLRLTTLRYADEVISVKSLELPKIPLSEKELSIGIELVNQLTAPFRPQDFENEHQKKLHRLIEKKARGVKISVLRPRRQKPTSADKLLEALEASLKKVA